MTCAGSPIGRLREANVSHFLGAIVIQQQEGQVGSLGTWTVIDGQQRLTTLQLLRYN